MAVVNPNMQADGDSLADIGRKMGFSRERARQLVMSGLEKIHDNLTKAGISYDDLDPSDIRMILTPRYIDPDDT